MRTCRNQKQREDVGGGHFHGPDKSLRTFLNFERQKGRRLVYACAYVYINTHRIFVCFGGIEIEVKAFILNYLPGLFIFLKKILRQSLAKLLNCPCGT